MTTDFAGRPVVVGVGCASAATPDEIIALIDACLREAGIRPSQIAALATHIRKFGSLALVEAAGHFGVPLRFLDDDELAHGVPGTAEAVAAAAGPLRLGKRKSAYATCAIALGAPGFSPARFGQPSSPSAAMASSSVATSVAGP